MKDTTSIKQRFNVLPSEAHYDTDHDFHKQEISYLLSLPNTSLYDLTQEHMKVRGYKDRGMPEHEATHLLLGIINHERSKAGLLKPEDHHDFQTGLHAEVFAFDLETRISPDGIIANYRKNNPDEAALTPFDPKFEALKEVATSYENYIRTMSWLIGTYTGDRTANFRYVNSNPETDEVFRNKLAAFLKERGYQHDFAHDADTGHLSTDVPEWRIETPDGKVYSWNATSQPCLPSGHNGVEEFPKFIFPDQSNVSEFYDIANPIVEWINQQGEGKSMMERLTSIKTVDLVSRIQEQIRNLPCAPDTSHDYNGMT